jgi:tetratricopeptide (TPR) repeat protein
MSAGRILPEALILFLLLTFFSTVAATGQETPNSGPKLEHLSLQAQEAQSRGDYSGAAATYRQILKIRPDLAEARANLGLMHHLLGEYTEAIQDFEAAVRQKPQLFTPNLFLGLDLLRLRQPLRAVTFLERASQLNPSDEQATLGLAQAYLGLREYEKASNWYLRATKLNPRNADAWYGLGMTYVKLAERAAEQLGRAGPDSVYAQILLAESFEQRGRLGDAAVIYRRLVDAHPDDPQLRAALGFAYIEQNALADATHQFEAALKSNPGCLLARLGAARVSIERGDLTGLQTEARKVLESDKEFFRHHLFCLWRGLKAERIDEFERQLRTLKAQEPTSAVIDLLISSLGQWRQASAEASLGLVDAPWDSEDTSNSSKGSPSRHGNPAQLYSAGHYSACVEALQRKLPQLPASDLLLLSECAYHSGDFRASFLASGRLSRVKGHELPALYWRARTSERLAVGALMKAGLAEPDSPRVHVLLGDAYRAKQDYKEAAAEYQRAIQLNPDTPAAHLGLATTYYKSLKFDEAFGELIRVLEMDPQDPDANFIAGDIMVFRRQYEDAIPYLRVALKGGQANLPAAHALLGKAYAATGRLRDGLAEVKQSLAADSDGGYHYQLYQLYKKLGDAKAAAAALQKSEALRRSKSERERATLRSVP